MIYYIITFQKVYVLLLCLTEIVFSKFVSLIQECVLCRPPKRGASVWRSRPQLHALSLHECSQDVWPFDATIYLERLIWFAWENGPLSTTYQFESSAEHNYHYTVHNYYTLLPLYHFTPVEIDHKWNNKNGVLGHICAHWLNRAGRTSRGWWDEFDDSALRTHDSKFELWPSEASNEQGRNVLFLWNLNARAGLEPAIFDFPSRQL